MEGQKRGRKNRGKVSCIPISAQHEREGRWEGGDKATYCSTEQSATQRT